ncbi:MAG: DUF998 domain-containing protein [Actinomycetota bacterium]
MGAPGQIDARRESRAIAAAWASFGSGAVIALIALAGPPRPIAGEGSVALPAAVIAAVITAACVAISSVVHRRAETAPMPGWQRLVAHASAGAITLALAAVAYLGVLTGGEILALGLQGLEAPAVGGALLTGVASAAGGWLAFQAGVELRTSDLATLLFAFLTIGTVFAMLTAADPRWWERHFSRLGADWAFNLTLIVAGLLVAVIGAYLGRDLHRWLGDTALRRIAVVVALFAVTGLALAAVGVFPVHRAPVLHNIAAFGTLGLFVGSGIAVIAVMPRPPLALLLTSAGAALALVVALLLWWPFRLYSATALEAIAVGVVFVWLTTLVRTLAALAPQDSLPSRTASPLRAVRVP